MSLKFKTRKGGKHWCSGNEKHRQYESPWEQKQLFLQLAGVIASNRFTSMHAERNGDGNQCEGRDYVFLTFPSDLLLFPMFCFSIQMFSLLLKCSSMFVFEHLVRRNRQFIFYFPLGKLQSSNPSRAHWSTGNDKSQVDGLVLLSARLVKWEFARTSYLPVFFLTESICMHVCNTWEAPPLDLVSYYTANLV